MSSSCSPVAVMGIKAGMQERGDGGFDRDEATAS